jgi:hypothetical protein
MPADAYLIGDGTARKEEGCVVGRPSACWHVLYVLCEADLRKNRRENACNHNQHRQPQQHPTWAEAHGVRPQLPGRRTSRGSLAPGSTSFLSKAALAASASSRELNPTKADPRDLPDALSRRMARSTTLPTCAAKECTANGVQRKGQDGAVRSAICQQHVAATNDKTPHHTSETAKRAIWHIHVPTWAKILRSVASTKFRGTPPT